MKRHGHPLDAIYTGMMSRCCDETNNAYYRYGGRGITICPMWLDFERFVNDMGERPSKAHTLDRIDNDGPYSKQNCRWATWTEQQNNRRDNRLLRFNGKEMTASEWAIETGIKRTTIYRRFHAGWPVADILTIKPNKNNSVERGTHSCGYKVARQRKNHVDTGAA